MDVAEYVNNTSGYDNIGTDENPVMAKRKRLDPIFSGEHIYKIANGTVALKVANEISVLADKPLLTKEKVDEFFKKLEFENRSIDHSMTTFPIQ